jgi:hypothetical protein
LAKAFEFYALIGGTREQIIKKSIEIYQEQNGFVDEGVGAQVKFDHVRPVLLAMGVIICFSGRYFIPTKFQGKIK